MRYDASVPFDLSLMKSRALIRVNIPVDLCFDCDGFVPTPDTCRIGLLFSSELMRRNVDLLIVTPLIGFVVPTPRTVGLDSSLDLVRTVLADFDDDDDDDADVENDLTGAREITGGGGGGGGGGTEGKKFTC